MKNKFYKFYKFFVILYSLLLFSSNCISQEIKVDSKVLDKKIEKHFKYDVYYKKTHIGIINRIENWNGENINVKVYGKLFFLFIPFGGEQDSNIYWNKSKKQFLTKNFKRETYGLGGASISGEFAKDALSSKLINKGKIEEFKSSKQSDLILDLNAVQLQACEYIKSGKKEFDFLMQTSDSIAHYFFEVKSEEIIDTAFGKINTFRLEQTQKNDRTFTIWFAPELDHQIVKFHYKRKLLNLRAELSSQRIDFK